ncbi:MAG TPA: ArsA family ATPase [Acidimicrobiales bacterium]|nr:ArsA family ATPase [Acidimicrobiales bacterium]
MSGGLAAIARERRVVVCCGSGGVGKTTSAATLALEAARQGRRACVVTIDPAKRLADALGLESLSNVPGRIQGDWTGELHALMLDTKSTFDALVRRYAATPEQADSILANRLYRNMAGALSGTQEYMAMEKLYELASGGDYDLIVIDTPPTRNALDFLDAPRRLTRFLDNRIFKLLMMPTRAYLKAVSLATQTFLRTISKVVGGEVVADAVAFFQAFEGMEQGFRDRAADVLTMLQAASTAFVLVTSPRRDAVEEAAFFADKLQEAGITVDGLVVNRLHPSFGREPVPEGLGDLGANLADFRSIAEREEQHFAALAARIAPAPVARVPFLADDVHDLEGLAVIGGFLFAD